LCEIHKGSKKVEKRRFSFRRVYPHKPDQKGESAMKLEVTVSEIADIFKEIQERPGQLFEMIRLDIREVVGKYLTAMMNAELTHFLGREPYVRVAEAVNHRNGSYGRGFALKGVGEVRVDIPRDRNGEFKTSAIPRSNQYEEEIARDFSIMFLAGINTRTLSGLGLFYRRDC
jgi:putative transposase